MTKAERRNRIIYSLVGTIFYMIVVSILFDIPFYTNDQVLMRSIANGSYAGSSNGHLIYIIYPLSAILAFLYKTISVIDWYDLLVFATFPVAYFSLFYKLNIVGTIYKNKVKDYLFCGLKWLVFTALFVLITLKFYVQNEYTVDAAIYASVGFVFLLTSDFEKKEMADSIVSLVFFLLTLQLRKEVFFELIPLIIIALFYQFLKLNANRRLLVYALLLSVFTIIFLSLNSFMYRGTDWQDYKEYNQARTVIFDYNGLPSFEENEADYMKLGVTGAEVNALFNGLALIDTADAQTLSEVAKLSDYERAPLFYQKRFIFNEMTKTVKDTLKQPIGFICLSLFVYIFTGSLCKALKEKNIKAFMPGLLSATVMAYYLVFLVWLIYKGRYPEKITFGLIWVITVILATIPVKSEEFFRKKTMLVLVTAVSIISITLTGKRVISDNKENSAFWAKYLSGMHTVVEYTDSRNNDFFYMSPSVSNYLCNSIIRNKLEIPENAFAMNYWTTGSPIYYERLERIGLERLSDKLTKGEGTYILALVTDDLSWFSDLCEVKGLKVDLVRDDSFSSPMGEMIVYKISVSE